jgi:hypothetical protein
VDISGSLNVVRTIKYGGDAKVVILLSELAPNVKAIGRNTCMYGVTEEPEPRYQGSRQHWPRTKPKAKVRPQAEQRTLFRNPF